MSHRQKEFWAMIALLPVVIIEISLEEPFLPICGWSIGAKSLEKWGNDYESLRVKVYTAVDSATPLTLSPFKCIRISWILIPGPCPWR